MVTLAFKIICAVHIHFSMSKIMCTKNSTICNKLASKCTPLNNNDFVVYSRICVFVVVVVFINDLIIYINFVYIWQCWSLSVVRYISSAPQLMEKHHSNHMTGVRLELNWKFQQWVNYINRTCCGWNWFWFTTFADSLEYDDGEYIDCWLYWGCT